MTGTKAAVSVDTLSDFDAVALNGVKVDFAIPDFFIKFAKIW